MDIIKTGQTWVICTGPILDALGARLTGLTDIKFSMRRYTSGAWQWLDTADSTFRAVPAGYQFTMTAVDATKVAGVYGYALDMSAITNVAFGDQLFVDIQQTTLTTAVNANQGGEGVYGYIVDKVEANLNATVGSRAAAGDAMALIDDAITAAKIATDAFDAASFKADAITKIQAGLASRAMMVFDAEFANTLIGEQVYFPYFKNGAPVLGAEVKMMISRMGAVGPGYEFQTLDHDAEIFVPPEDNTYPLFTMGELDASMPGIYKANAYASGFASNAVTPEVYTVWFYDGAELVGMGRLRVGMADTVAALPANIIAARDHIEAHDDAQFLLIKGGTFNSATDSLEALRDRGDAAWVTANISGLATSTNVTDGVTNVLAGIASAHGNGSYITASVAGLATTAQLDAHALAIKGASFDTNTDALRAIRVLVSALPAAPDVASIRDAVWADDDAAPVAGTRRWEIWRMSQWITETNPKKIVGQELRLYTPGLGAVLAAILLKDAANNDIEPGAGEPAQYLP